MTHGGRNRLIRLWQKDNCCHWCKEPTVLVVAPPGQSGKMRHAPMFDERATIDHLNSRLSGQRHEVSDWTELTVLSCSKCNQERNRQEELALPIEELHRRSGKSPKVNDVKETQCPAAPKE